jgi:hypothetical protein
MALSTNANINWNKNSRPHPKGVIAWQRSKKLRLTELNGNNFYTSEYASTLKLLSYYSYQIVGVAIIA